MHMFSANSPLGPFECVKRLYKGFSIDAHVFVDGLLDLTTVEKTTVEILPWFLCFMNMLFIYHKNACR